MKQNKTITAVIALILCISMLLSMCIVAAGEGIPDGDAETSTQTSASTPGSEPSGSEPGSEPPPSEPPVSEPPASEPPASDPSTSEPVVPPTTGPDNPPDNPDDDPEEEPDDGKMHVSDAFMEVLKKLEGFSPYAFWDYKQYSIGYGTKCPDGMENYYTEAKGNAITEEYAEELLRQELDEFENTVNNFIQRNELKLEQHQFDALICFTYNTGYAWTSKTGNLVTAVINGDTGSHLLYGLMLWSMAGNRHILINRRIIELNMYANAVYPEDVYADEAVPERYRIAFMEGNGGTVKYDEHGFDALQPIAIKTEFKSYPTGPDENGATVTYEFDGWYTERIGGTKVEILDESIPTGTVLYAHWKTPSGTPVVIPRLESDLKIKVTVTGVDVNVRCGPDTYYAMMYQAQPGDVLEIQEVVQRGTLLWGRFGERWIALKYTDYNNAIKEQFPKEGVIIANTLNVRTGAGTNYALVEGAQKKKGDVVTVTQWKTDGTMMWGKIKEGWIALPYVTFEPLPEPEKTVQSIQISQNPAKLSYIHKVEMLDITGGKILVTYSDGSTEVIDMTAEMVSGFDNAVIGANTVTVTYEGQTATFEVQIVKAKVTFLMDDGTIISEKEYLFGDTVEIPEVPQKPADNTYRYEFAGWDQEVQNCTGNAIYKATFTPVYIDYAVEFQDEDGKVISQQTYHWGDVVTIPDAPVKPADNTYTYTFAGWDKEVATTCGGNAVYKATFTPVYIDYTVEFQDEDGKVISQQTYHWGDAITIPDAPVKPADNTYTYTFAGWDKEVATTCGGNATYMATYKSAYIEYTVTFQYEDGTVIKQETLHYGDVVVAPENPAVPDGYAFLGWDKEITVCQGDATYTVVFEKRVIPGDLDNNGLVNSDDVIQLLLHISLPDMFPINSNADYTKDGAVTSDDVVQLLLHISLPDMFPL